MSDTGWPTSELQGLTSLELSNPVSDAGLAYFKDCKGLTRLDLVDTKVSDAGLANFKDCKNLTTLSLDRTQVGDAGMVHFQDCKALTDLSLAGTKVSDVGLAHFKDCKNLKLPVAWTARRWAMRAWPSSRACL